MRPASLSTPLTRRRLIIGSAAASAMLTLPAARPLLAAQATTDLSTMGYPALSITVTGATFEGVPAETAAGRYLINATYQPKDYQGAVAFLSGTPVGLGSAELLQLLSSQGGGATTTSGATPMAGGTPAAGGAGANQAPPLIAYQFYFAGGAGFPPVGVIDLKPGEYVVWGDDPTLPQKPVALKVTGDYPANVKDPSSDITATLIDFAISFEGNLTAGKHIMKVQHHGAQPHFLSIEKGPDTMTKDQVMTAIMSPPNATPAAGGLNPSDLQPVFFSPTQSIGTDTWHPIELTAGTYFAACFFPTAGTGVPHAFNGMVDVFKVT